MEVVEELEFVRLLDGGEWWVIEDKILIKYPVVSRGKTSTLYEMWFDFVELPDGTRLIGRAYYPKNIPLKIVRNTLYTWNEKWRKKIAEAAPALEQLGIQVSNAGAGEEVGELQALEEELQGDSPDNYEKRLKKYSRYVR